MEDNLSFMNWGFAPSKNASGWILHWSSTYWYADMRARDVYNYPGISYSLEKPFKELVFELIWDRLNYYFYEMGMVEDIILDYFEFSLGRYGLTIMGDSVRFPTDLEYWFPILINEAIDEDDYERIRVTLEPIIEDDDWLQEGLRKFIDQTLKEITNTEILQKVEKKELKPLLIHFYMGDYDDININAINLQKLRS